MDVDGTLTDGKIYMSAEGELLKAFNIKDGYAIAHLPEKDIIPVIITGRSSKILLKRCGELGILELHQGIENKVSKLLSICDKYQVKPSNVAYIGDDLNDLECIKICGYTAAPADAVEEVVNQKEDTEVVEAAAEEEKPTEEVANEVIDTVEQQAETEQDAAENLQQVVDQLQEEIDTLKAENEQLKKKNQKMSKKPSTKVVNAKTETKQTGIQAAFASLKAQGLINF